MTSPPPPPPVRPRASPSPPAPPLRGTASSPSDTWAWSTPAAPQWSWGSAGAPPTLTWRGNMSLAARDSVQQTAPQTPPPPPPPVFPGLSAQWTVTPAFVTLWASRYDSPHSQDIITRDRSALRTTALATLAALAAQPHQQPQPPPPPPQQREQQQQR